MPFITKMFITYSLLKFKLILFYQSRLPCLLYERSLSVPKLDDFCRDAVFFCKKEKAPK